MFPDFVEFNNRDMTYCVNRNTVCYINKRDRMHGSSPIEYILYVCMNSSGNEEDSNIFAVYREEATRNRIYNLLKYGENYEETEIQEAPTSIVSTEERNALEDIDLPF